MFNLLPYRVLVLADEGSDNIGVIVENTLRGYSGLIDYPASEDPENPEDPLPNPIYHDHIVFIKEMATEVEIDDVTYLVMNIEAIVGYITD